MQEKHLFEYAVIRLIPRVEREEFINVGVILYCSGERFLQTAYEINEARIGAFTHAVEPEEVRKRLQMFQQICQGGKQGGPIGQLPLASRFRWLTASCSTIIQTSPVHPGLSTNAQQTLDRLLKQLVL